MEMTNQAPPPPERISQSTQPQSELTSSERFGQIRRHYLASLPLWRQPFVGYLCALLLPLATLGITLYLGNVFHFLFPATPIYILIVIIAVIWGTGPAILSVIESVVLLYFFILPQGNLFPTGLGDVLQLLPVLATCILIVCIIAQRERTFIKTHFIKQKLEKYSKELKNINLHLEQKDREREYFFAVASHELKNPITSIRGHSQFQLRRLTKSSIDINDIISVFKNINEQTSRITALINEFVDINALSQEKEKLNKSSCDLNILCREVVEDQRLISNRSINFDPAPFPVNMQIDVERITQVLVNLVGNALKYSPDDTVVELRLVRNPNNVCVEVQDFGSGIAPDQLPHIFDAFYRTPDAVASTTSGHGLGLAIVKDMVTRHGGSVRCESVIGRGSTFFVELPLAEGVD